MQLKKITVCGFKSFADKTVFDFGPGVTVIVGPNGCGKSNVVDAVKWVLGEQSAKSLRGGQMLDVIFNGTTSRKSSGLAEVTLTFDNSSHMLSADMEEVAVTRKLFRSGESQYLLNNQPCRLKDIREMFMDTGIGADAYSIIEQGKVATLLQASKEDRRAIFEEAAGISRYKARKKEAIRKLERTQQNLLRLEDIIAELEKRLRSIRYQAGKARNYQTYMTRLQELRLNKFLADYHQLQQESKQGEENFRTVQDDLIAITTEVEKVQARLSVLDHEIDEADREGHHLETELLQCTSQIASQQDRIEAGHTRCSELDERIDHARKQLRQMRQQARDLQQQMEADAAEVEEIQELLAAQQDELARLQESRQSRALELNEYRAQLDDEKTGVIDIVRRTAQLHNEISSLDERQDNLAGQKSRLHDRHGRISAEVEELLTGRAQLHGKLEQIETLLDDSQTQLEAKRQQLAEISEQRLACNENLAAARENRTGLLSRQQVLADMEAKLEGVDAGVRHIITTKADNGHDGAFYYVKGMVAELIQADIKYAGIIEAALDDASQKLVATSSQAVLDDATVLQELPGRVQMLCLDQLGPYKNGYDFSQHPEVRARAIDFVTFAPEMQQLAWHLLGNTIVVENIAAALRLAPIVPAGYRWVSLEGEVLEADGTLHLGPQSGRAQLISRKSELAQLEQSLAEADERICTLSNQAEQFASQAGHLERNLQELRTAIYETNTEKVETTGRLEQVDQNVERLKQEQPIIASEVAALEQQIAEAAAQQDSSRQNLVDLEAINKERQERIDVLEETIRTLEAEDRSVLDQITEVKVVLGQTQQKRLALRERLNATETQLQQVRHSLGTLDTDITNAQHSHETAQRGILTAESLIAELFLKRQQTQEQARAMQQRRGELHQEKDELTETARTQNQQREELQEKLHAAQMNLNELRLRSENLVALAQERVGLDLADYYQKLITGQLRLPGSEPEQSEEAQAEESTEAAPQEGQPAATAEGEAAEKPAAEASQEEEQEDVTEQQTAITVDDLNAKIDWDAVAAEIADLEKKVQRLGNVNLEAISEQEELEERAQYLSQQDKDLNESRRQLEELIEKINTESEQRFLANFAAIQDNFAELFRKLFGGGRAEIILEDPENILECGIEIVARPPGKQLQSISLMSGGEKTMTAVALLLGIFKSKPSPFCLLDEVDAALDEANIERFTLVVQEFLEKSQFVIITHARRTMSIADNIYGVTMQEQGVSKKVSVRFAANGEAEEESDTAVA